VSYLVDGYHTDRPVAAAMPAERASFIRRTYGHLAGAILVFAIAEAALIQSGAGEQVMRQLFTGGAGGMLVLMLLFIGGGYLAQYWARSATSAAMQYAGLGLYIALEVVIFLPLLTIAAHYANDPYVIHKAGLLTLGVFAGLTMAVFMTGQDFSFMRTGLVVAGWLSVGVILGAMIFGYSIGTWFSLAMVGLAAAYIIYDTSNVLHHYRTDQYVGASLQLFASVALMFYYVLRIMLESNRRS